MTTSHSAHRGQTHYDDVVGVEVTIDGMLVIADRLNLMDFPVALGIRLNIPQLDLRDIVWEQVARDLTAQGVLDSFGEPHPEVAAMVDTLSRADRTLECRWWRRDVGGKMVRFVVCRKFKGMRGGWDPLTALNQVAAVELHRHPGLTRGKCRPSERRAPYVAMVRQLMNRSQRYLVAVVGSGDDACYVGCLPAGARDGRSGFRTIAGDLRRACGRAIAVRLAAHR